MSKKSIETPVKGFNGLVAGVQFVDGKGSTDDEAALGYFERQGYTISGKADDERKYPLGDPSDKWKKAELLAYAADHKKDIGEAKTVEQLWNAIKPGGTPYKGVTKPNGEAIVGIQGDLNDESTKPQADLPENVK